MPDILIVIDQQEAKEHPKWGPRNNHDAEKNIARLLSAWRARGWPIFHVRHDSTYPDSPFRPGQGGNDKHHDFRVSVRKLREDGASRVVLSTAVSPHNILGKAYLFVILPFHRIGVRTLLSNAVRAGRV